MVKFGYTIFYVADVTNSIEFMKSHLALHENLLHLKTTMVN